MADRHGGTSSGLRKVLVIGLDAATLNLIQPWAEEGRLPNSARFFREGAYGHLESVPNMNSASAWSSLVTGKNPGKHGIFWFVEENVQDYEHTYVNASFRDGAAVWRILSEQGKSNILAERFLVSFLPVGMVSALVYARRILHAVDTVFLASVSTAFLPRLSAQSVMKNITEFKKSLALGVKLTAFLALPVVAVFMALNLPVVRLLFQRGAFSLQAAGITASIMTLYMIGIAPMAALQMLTASYYAFQDTRTPLYIRLAMLAINLVLDLLLLQIMSARGLALALSLSRLITVVGAFWLLQRTIGAIRNNLDRFFVKLGVATLAMGTTMIILRRTLEMEVIPSTFLGLLVEVGVVTLAGILIYNLAVVLLRVEEVERVVALVRARVLTKAV